MSPKNEVRYFLSVFLLLGLLFSLTSCSEPRKVSASFYYWKTNFSENSAEMAALRHLDCRKVYMRIMDLDWNPELGAVAPVSPINFTSKPADTLEIVPVVFIVNSSLTDLNNKELDVLSGRILQFVQAKLEQAGRKTFRELQIDCDWTKTTRSNYFYLVDHLRTTLHKNNQQLSVTLRLHQYKNRSLGIPPSDRVTLMCYNMGNLRQYGEQNSIMELSELKKYIRKSTVPYPLPLDIALGLFSWTVVFRNKEYIGISRIDQRLLNRKDLFQKKQGSIFIAQEALPGYGLRRGDFLRHEAISGKELLEASQLLKKHVNSQDSLSIIFYHLDEHLLRKFPYEDLEKAVDIFN